MDRLNPSGVESLSSAPPPECDLPGSLGDLQAALAIPQPSLQERLARIVRTIEADIIPRLVRAHRPPPAEAAAVAPSSPPPLDAALVAPFVQAVLADNEGAWQQTIERLSAQGVTIEAIYLDLLTPAARELGRMWEDDDVLFSDVTVGVGRLQRLMRRLSPAFGREVDHPSDGRRALLLPAPGEQHTFGLAMVAEFFRRGGWDVICDLDGKASDPVSLVRGEWFDVVGISAGVDARVDWLKAGITAVRHASRNRAVGVMVGGPIFVADPARAAAVGADATASDGRQAPIVAETLLDQRARRL
jgi:methanogenic corrinoid protein MtbC1